MPSAALFPLETSAADWISAVSTLAAAVFSLLAVVFARRAWQTAQRQLQASRVQDAAARSQDLALRVDAQLVAPSTGELAAARSRIYLLARSSLHRRGGITLSIAQRDDCFQLLWALQRVSVLVPVISRSSTASIRVLTEQINQIMKTLTLLGDHLSSYEKESMSDAVESTKVSLRELEGSLRILKTYPRPSWSSELDKHLCKHPTQQQRT